ncbi:hypothetical protein H6G96_33600 [Nostoc sp. FACHB-892]|uniref:hypothetical protein n=1 Tax=Nostoc sp. FACHB-892 TaxID=2692843 RepID=UPI00168943ED|nr:hypothetical protein [Nostoc sp. FACHB-892]MBD2731120.1 hypothetical protein [Nostoc sp. FACHB-892]
MIGKQTKGRGFRKLLDYLESREDAKLIGGNMSGRNARELAREFKLSRQLNSDADRVVYQVKMSPKILSFFTDFSHSIRLNSLMTQIQAVSTEEFVR